MNWRDNPNNPGRRRELKSPEEVKAMLIGEVSEDRYPQSEAEWEATSRKQQAELEAEEAELEFEVQQRLGADGVTYINPGNVCDELLKIVEPERCLTCGRKSDCCCQGCETCPQTKMASGKISAGWAAKQNAWSGTDPREGSM